LRASIFHLIQHFVCIYDCVIAKNIAVVRLAKPLVDMRRVKPHIKNAKMTVIKGNISIRVHFCVNFRAERDP